VRIRHGASRRKPARTETLRRTLLDALDAAGGLEAARARRVPLVR
jgi:hypothetical protein